MLNYDRIENDKLISYYGKNIPEGSIIRFKPISASTEGTEITGLAICGIYGESASNGYDTLGSLRFDSDKAYIEIITSRYYHHLQIAKYFENGTYNGTTAYCTYDILIIPNDNRLSLYKENIKLTNRMNNLYNVPHNSMVTSIDGMLIYLTKDGIKINWSTTALVLLFTGTTYFFPTRENSDYAEVDEINFDFNTANATYALVYNTKLYEFSIKKLEAYNIKLDMYDIILCYACINTNSIISYYTAITNHFFINNIENVSLKIPYLYSGKRNNIGAVKDWEVTTGEKYKIQIWNIENTTDLSKIVMFYFRNTDKTDYVGINDRIVYYNYIEYNIDVTEDMKWLRIYTSTNTNFEWSITKVTDNFNSDDLNTGLIKSILSDNTKSLVFGSSSCNIFKKVVCCGDSYTSGYISGVTGISGTNEDYAWPHYMELLTGNTWINCGHSGASSITWLTWDRGLPKAQTAGKTQAYVLGLQLNDVSDSGRAVDLGTIEDIGADTDTTRTYYAGISRIIRELNTISPKAKIFVNTCPRTGGKYDTYNQALRDIVNEYKNTYPVHLIDLVNYKKYYDQISGDNVGGHYTAIGYERFAEIYKYVLSEYINTHITDFQDVHTIEYD